MKVNNVKPQAPSFKINCRIKDAPSTITALNFAVKQGYIKTRPQEISRITALLPDGSHFIADVTTVAGLLFSRITEFLTNQEKSQLAAIMVAKMNDLRTFSILT